MAHWKARAEFLLSVIELLFLSLMVEALQGKMCQNSLPSGGARSLGSWSQDFRGKGRAWGKFFSFYKTRHILLSDSANCMVLCVVVFTQHRRVTDRRTDGQMDRQTDGIGVASTALAMRALRSVVKRSSITLNKNSTRTVQRAINQGSTPPLLRQNGDKVPKFVVFWTISTIQDEKSAAKFHYIKTVSGKVVAQENSLK